MYKHHYIFGRKNQDRITIIDLVLIQSMNVMIKKIEHRTF